MLVSGATALEKELLACRIVFWYVPRCPPDLPLLPGGGKRMVVAMAFYFVFIVSLAVVFQVT
jgi:hypothetical protein